MALGEELIDQLHIERGSLVALVGGGGKTTLMQELYRAGTERGWSCLAGTTAKVYANQAGQLPGFLHGQQIGDKLRGLSLADMDRFFSEQGPDLLVVEADGSRGRRVKAPAEHEPPIPLSTTLVIAVIGADSINRVIEDVAHRPMRVAAVCGCGPYERLTPERACRLLTSERGSRKNTPTSARFAVAITRIGPRQVEHAQQLADLLRCEHVPVVQLQSL